MKQEMPRIDPLDLLKCLGVLLSNNGGIKGPTEVDRVARLMLRFSKKLVSKCIYIHVLKATSTELLDQFLNQNGAYVLVMRWLAEALQSRNTPLLAEMLELLQVLPLSDARLKDPEITEFIRTSLHYNDLAQLIQSIAQDSLYDQNCRNLAMQFWSRWLTKPSQPDEFTLAQESILPEDMDLSIYAPDTSSATFGDPLNIGMGVVGEDVGMTINNLPSLDMNNCAQFMENSEFYTMNHFESTSLTNNLEQANHQVFMDSSSANFANDALSNQQPIMHQLQQPASQMHQPVMQQQTLVHPVMSAPIEPNNTILSSAVAWTDNNLGAAPVVSENNHQEPMVVSETRASEPATGLPILKIKIEGQKYVLKNSTDDVEMKDESLRSAEQLAEIKEKEKPNEKSKDKEKSKEKDKEKSRDKEKKKDKDKDKDKDRDKKSSSKSKDDGKKSSSSDSKKRDKERDREKSKSSSSSSKDKSSSSSSSSKDKSKSSSSSRDEKKDRDKERDKSKIKSSPKTEAQLKEAKQAEKNRETLAALKAMTPSVKLAKIPRKKTDETNAEAAAAQSGTNVTDVLDKLAPRPKTVKTFNSKFRSTGLVEEPAAVGSKKPSAASSPSSIDRKSPIIKRTGSSDGLIPPADKKPKTIDDSAISAAVAAVMKKTAGDVKPAVKLISPRPRPLLQDSSLFMDALEAGSKVSAKKKRTLKDGVEMSIAPIKSQDSPAAVSVTSPAPPPTPPIAVLNAAPVSNASSTVAAEVTTGDISPVPLKPTFKFYQDTLEADDATNEGEKSITETKETKEEPSGSPSGDKGDEAVEGNVEAEDGNSRDSNKTDIADEEIPTDETKPKGVLVIHSQQKRRPKKSLKWRDEELEMYHYFELDETERVNVNKLQFFEMKQAEREREKQAVKMSKHLTEEPEVEEQPWRPLIPIDLPEDRIVYGENSQEKHIQEARESSTLQALYFKGQVLPDSPAEPDPEVPLERIADPTVIPLDDVTGNPESIYDHRHVPWPEPKLYGSSSYQTQQSQLPKHAMGPSHQPYGPPSYRGPGAGPAEPYYSERGPAMLGDHPGYGTHPDMHGYGGSDMHPDGPDMLHGGPDMPYGGPDMPYGGPDMHHGGPPMHHQYQTVRGGPPGRADDRGTWMAGDGSVYPEHGGPRYDGPPLRDQRHPRDSYREIDLPRDRGMAGGYGGGPGPGYMGPPRGMNMDGPRPRFHGPPRGGRGGGPPPGRGGPSTQPCWHFMRGFCRLENRCKFLHPSNYNGAPMP